MFVPCFSFVEVDVGCHLCTRLLRHFPEQNPFHFPLGNLATKVHRVTLMDGTPMLHSRSFASSSFPTQFILVGKWAFLHLPVLPI
jgi:hypothetical protein